MQNRAIPKIPEKVVCPQCKRRVRVNKGLDLTNHYYKNVRCLGGLQATICFRYEVTEIEVSEPLTQGTHLLFGLWRGENTIYSLPSTHLNLKFMDVGIRFSEKFFDLEGNMKTEESRSGGTKRGT